MAEGSHKSKDGDKSPSGPAEFDYNTPDVSAEALAEIVGEISRGGLKPLSDEQIAERNLQHAMFLDQCRERRERDERQRAEYERRQTEAATAKQAELQRQTRERVAAEYRERTSRQTRDRSLTTLLDHAVQQKQFRQAAVRSATLAQQRSRLSSALDNALATINPPPPPEPAVVVVSEDDGSADFGARNFDPAKWAKKPRSWW